MARFLWTQKQDSGPKPRLAASIAFDSNRGRVILFGGDSLRSQLFNDTWAWDGEFWTQMADLGPSPRSGHAMAYDSVRQRVVLFGGRAGAESLRDTWEWSGEDWTQVADDGPSARLGHAMAFDSVRKRIVLFGGEAPGVGILRDTWEWDGDAWTQVEDSGPSARKTCAAAYDSVRRRLVLFGGDSGAANLRDTWEWDGTVWTQVADFGPEPCMGAAMVFKNDNVVLFGGAATPRPPAPTQVFGDTWEWNGTHWTERQDIGPGSRWGHSMAFDSTRSSIVMFGGLPVFPPTDPGVSDRLFGDTWEHTENATPVPSPGELESFVITPPTVLPGVRATGVLTLRSTPDTAVRVILSAPPNALLFDPPVTSEVVEGVSRPVLQFSAGTRSLQFTFRDLPGAVLPGPIITITATLRDSTLSATITIL
jgi:hypothetical protein